MSVMSAGSAGSLARKLWRFERAANSHGTPADERSQLFEPAAVDSVELTEPLHITRPLQAAKSLRCLFPHWHMPNGRLACCPRHAALRSANELIRQLSKQPCDPSWSTFSGWQCEACTCVNDDAGMTCAVCDVMCFSSNEIEFGHAFNEDTDASSSSVDDVRYHAQLAERDAADTARTGAHGCNCFWPD